MFLYALLGLTVVACASAVKRWRWGPFLMIVVGLLQDPVRKLTPGVPAFLTLPAACVWGCTMIGAVLAGDIQLDRFMGLCPRLSKAMRLFCYLLIPPTIASLTYAAGAWRITALGLFMYGSLLLGMMVGAYLPTNDRSARRVLLWYLILCAPLVAGTLMEKLGFQHPVLGAAALGHRWITYRMGSQGVMLLAGFFRSPDVNGWHSATVVMCAVILAVSCRNHFSRLLYGGVGGLALVSVMLCARRKMLAMIPVFLVVFMLLSLRHMKVRFVFPLLGLALLVGSVGSSVYVRMRPGAEKEAFLLSTVADADQRVKGHGWRAMVNTYRQAGFFGYGVGMASQGAHHLKGERPRTWQEGGTGKLMAELGIPGTIGFLYLILAIALTLWSDLPRTRGHPQLFCVHAGLIAILLANGTAGVVSAQIFGDPFIASLLSLFLGLALSASRVRPVEVGVRPSPNLQGVARPPTQEPAKGQLNAVQPL